MKVIVNEVQNEGLEALLGQTVTLWCGVYIYTGKLVGVNGSCVKLTGAKVVYETGPFTDAKGKDAQDLGAEAWYVQTAAIESFGVMSKT